MPYLELSSSISNGWIKADDGLFQVDWIEGDIMPNTLADILADQETIERTDGDEELEMVEEDGEIDNIIDIVFQEDKMIIYNSEVSSRSWIA